MFFVLFGGAAWWILRKRRLAKEKRERAADGIQTYVRGGEAIELQNMSTRGSEGVDGNAHGVSERV